MWGRACGGGALGGGAPSYQYAIGTWLNLITLGDKLGGGGGGCMVTYTTTHELGINAELNVLHNKYEV